MVPVEEPGDGNRWKNRVMAWLARPYFARQLRPRRVRDRGSDYYRTRYARSQAPVWRYTAYYVWQGAEKK